MFIDRSLGKLILKLSSQYPILTLLGPRQSGKSTLVKQVFSGYKYINLEAPDERKLIESDPRDFIENIPDNGIIIDEVQRFPELLSYLQVYVDQNNKNGQIILTGSHQLELHQAISQSLAGRTSILQLLPFSFLELQNYKDDYDLDDYILRGFYPKIYDHNIEPYRYYKDYVATYIEKDVRKMVNVKDLGLFQDFLQITAGRIGQLVNYSNISNELGLAVNTVKHWYSILEASYIIIKIRPYFENIGKRLVKANKIYFTDPGLACYLLGIENKEQLKRDPLRGNLFENMVVLDIIKNRYNQGKDHNLYFYRDSHQNEVDLIYKKAHDLIPIEIKISKTYNPHFKKGILNFKKNLKERVPYGFVIYGGDKVQSIGDDTKLITFDQSYTVTE